MTARPHAPGASRRALLQSAGALIVAFAMPAVGRAQTPRVGEDAADAARAGPSRPASTIPSGQIDAWIAIAPDGAVTLFTGKVELGTGVATALAQIAAEELDVEMSRVAVVQGDTLRTPDQGITAGSKTLQRGAPAIRQAAADARYTLRLLASVRLSTLGGSAGDARRRGERGPRSRPARELWRAGGRPPLQPAGDARLPDQEPRDLPGGGNVRAAPGHPGKVFGQWDYVHDLRVPGMLHGRVGPAPGGGERGWPRWTTPRRGRCSVSSKPFARAISSASSASARSRPSPPRARSWSPGGAGAGCPRRRTSTRRCAARPPAPVSWSIAAMWTARCAEARTRARPSTAGPFRCTPPSGRPAASRTSARPRRRSGREVRESSSCGGALAGLSASRPSASA